MMIELFGYLGSALVVVSMLMASIVKLRIINTAGCIISGTYALIIGSYPLAIMNGCLIVINIYNLFRLLKSEKKFDLISGKQGDAFLDYFLERYRMDMAAYFPGFKKEIQSDEAYLVCCDGTPAGVLLGRRMEKGVLDVVLDYSIPAYRDCSVGAYLYPQLKKKGIQMLAYAQQESASHVSYMKKMGFVRENQRYIKNL